jgi:hypothetical protein
MKHEEPLLALKQAIKFSISSGSLQRSTIQIKNEEIYGRCFEI